MKVLFWVSIPWSEKRINHWQENELKKQNGTYLKIRIEKIGHILQRHKFNFLNSEVVMVDSTNIGD